MSNAYLRCLGENACQTHIFLGHNRSMNPPKKHTHKQKYFGSIIQRKCQFSIKRKIYTNEVCIQRKCQFSIKRKKRKKGNAKVYLIRKYI